MIVSSAQKWQNQRRPIKFIGSCDTVKETTGHLNAHFAAAIKQLFYIASKERISSNKVRYQNKFVSCRKAAKQVIESIVV